jgi:hypothetical protein
MKKGLACSDSSLSYARELCGQIAETYFNGIVVAFPRP